MSYEHVRKNLDVAFTETSLEKATKVEQYSHELKIPISSIKDEVENHLEYLLSRLLIGKCTVEKACEIAMQKVVIEVAAMSFIILTQE